ncbi:MAG: hypothetical protein VB026_05335 [Anaerolineaceae bacterium]|nr:hypothetical protein [Anaerolineaceae bacterium]
MAQKKTGEGSVSGLQPADEGNLVVIKFRCRARVYSRPYAWLYSVTEMRMRLRPCTLGSWG